MKVAADRFDSRMQTLPREDFPDAARRQPATQGDAAARGAARDGAKTQFAITGEDTRYFLNGAQFVLQAGQPEAGGDRRPSPGAGRRSNARRTGVSGEEIEASSCRRRRCSNSASCWPRAKATSSSRRGENHLFFEVGGRVLISRMIDGQFPAYERVIPKGNDKHIEFDRDRLTSAVKRVALLSNERSRAVKFEIEQGQGRGDVEQFRVRRSARAAAGRLRRARR